MELVSVIQISFAADIEGYKPAQRVVPIWHLVLQVF